MKYIGVDPSFRKGGFVSAVVDYETFEVRYQTHKHVLEFDRWIYALDGDFIVCIENSNKQNKTFKNLGKASTNAKISRNVGTNQAVSELTVISATDRFGADKVFDVSPKFKGHKWNEAMSNAVAETEGLIQVNYTGTQDQRDAFKLALIGKYLFNKKVNA